MGSEAPLFQARKGGELQDTGDLGPLLVTCSTGDNCAGTSSAPWSLSLHPSCASKLSAALRELVWGWRGFHNSLPKPRRPSEGEVHMGKGQLGIRCPESKRCLATLGVQETWEVAAGRVPKRNGMSGATGRASGRE